MNKTSARYANSRFPTSLEDAVVAGNAVVQKFICKGKGTQTIANQFGGHRHAASTFGPTVDHHVVGGKHVVTFGKTTWKMVAGVSTPTTVSGTSMNDDLGTAILEARAKQAARRK